MGDLQNWSLSGSNLEERPSSPSSSSSSSYSGAVAEESWRRAEEVTQGIIAKIQPNSVSEERRRAVIDYIQRLLRGCLRCEVFPFGSVPLKTYLPDGDIDLTAFGGTINEDALANEVFSVLEREDQNGAAEFVVKDVQFIGAEVKLVKCIVQNIVVDISVNQLGGLSTLCFLEKVDRLIGKGNLFKRSIILIKAWCYYESRILGAHHGLISTYALETMVLYIFNILHTSLDGPLAVLYKFLDYFSKFDWEKYSVSLRGPIHLSSLPEIVVETSDKSAGEPLLSNDFLRECAEMFSLPSKALGATARTFVPKNLNIIDPLKEGNNLGRSVSKGNLVRIRSAFALGARKLEKILSQPDESLADELHTFFTSTLDRHGSGLRPDIQDNVLMYGYNGFGVNVPFQEDQYSALEPSNAIVSDGFLNYMPSVHALSNNITSPDMGMDILAARSQQSFMNSVVSANLPEAGFSNVNSICERRLFGDARDLASPRIHNLGMPNDTSRSSPPIEGCLVSKLDQLPHRVFSNSFKRGQDLINGSLERVHLEDSNVPSGFSQVEPGHFGHHPSVEAKNQRSRPSQLSPASEDFVPRHHALWAPSRAEPTRFLPDLGGDYESQLNSLQFGRRWFDYATGAPVPPVSPQFVPQYQGKNLWESAQQMPLNAPSPRPGGFYPPRNLQIAPSGPSVGVEDIPKPRGTGTYFPNVNHYKDRETAGWPRNQAAPAGVRSPRFNGRAMTFPETTSVNDRSDMEQPPPPLLARERSGSLEHNNNQIGLLKAPPSLLGVPTYSSEKTLQQLDSVVIEPVSLPESSNPPIAVTNSPKPPSPAVQWPRPVAGPNQDQERLPVQSYHLRDDDDFPPLSI